MSDYILISHTLLLISLVLLLAAQTLSLFTHDNEEDS